GRKCRKHRKTGAAVARSHLMKWVTRGTRTMNEPPAILLTDLAFNLLIFFVVLVSPDPDRGRKETFPGTSKEATPPAGENLQVLVTRTKVFVDTVEVPVENLVANLKPRLQGKSEREKIVVVKAQPDTTFGTWIRVTTLIRSAGGKVVPEVEESRDV